MSMHTLVGIVAILCAVGLPLSIPIVYLILSYRRRRRLLELHHQERMAAIERGMEIPPLPAERTAPNRTRSELLPGLIWLLLGLALTAAMHQLGAAQEVEGLAVWGLVPTAVGVAYLIYYVLEGRRHAEPPKDRP
jgi:hypothetical protein